jgi:murein DD-endopeptidase MepM/ murein hydrolase activator NlpD
MALLAGAILFPSFVFSDGGLTESRPPEMLRLIKRSEGSFIHFLVQNLEQADVTATFDLSLNNLKSSTRFPFTSTIPARQTVEAFTLEAETSEWNYTLTNYYTLGSHLAEHDDSVLYRLPYTAGQSFKVTQAFNGGFSHTGQERYAIDWKMPEGTQILAARAGTVVATKADSNRGGDRREFETDANYVLIQHADGTIGNYAHLKQGGVRVRIGESVAAGDLIGISGNTGFSSGPHLHFCVFKTRSGKERESIPIRFQTEGGVATTLRAGQVYTAPKTLLAAGRSRTKRAVN